MAYETPSRLTGRAITARAKLRSAYRRPPPVSAKLMFRAKLTAPERSEALNPQSPELVSKRFTSERTTRIATEQQFAALCHRRAAQWADAIRDDLDPDIGRFVRDQAAAWQLLAGSYARSARCALIGPLAE